MSACAWSLPGQGIYCGCSLSCLVRMRFARARRAGVEAVDGVPVEMDLQYRDIEKSASLTIFAALWTRAMIGIDSAPIRHQLNFAISVGSIVGANSGLSCQKQHRPGVRAGCDAGQTMDQAGFPRFAPWRKRRAVLFLPMRAWRAILTFMPGRPGGYAGKPTSRPTGKRFHLNMLSAISAKANCGS